MKFNLSRFFLAALMAIVLTLAASAWAIDTQSSIYTFQSRTDGATPMSGVIADGAGNLYGTTTAGGGACTAITKKGCGTVFELSPASGGTWTETILHAFTGGTSDGYSPQGLVFDASGNLYGITGAGGTGTVCIGGAGCGVIYELSPSSGGTWTETILYNFTGGIDGNEPWGSLAIDASGNLYGVTRAGGANLDGNVFELSPGSSGWTFTTLHSFATTGGYEPDSGVTLDAAGNLYGTTLRGGDETGTWGCSSGCGVVYRLSDSSTGWRYSQIYVFHGPGGYEPVSGVALDSTGNLYGTTFAGGTPTCCGFGVVFKLAPTTAGQWKETILHAFQNTTDGENPTATLTLDSAGHVFGTSGGLSETSPGAAFRLTPASGGGWQFQVLTALSAGSAYLTTAPLLRDSTGHMYSTAYGGGSTNCDGGCGSVYELSPVAGAK